MSRSLTCYIAIVIPAIVLVAIASSLRVQARAMTNSLPQCQQWNGNSGLDALWVSPVFTQDNALFAVGGSPPGYTFTYFYLRSADGGLSWSEMPITATKLGDMVFSQDYLCDQTLYFASVDNLLFRSTDGGQHWVNVPHPQAPGVLSVAVVTSSVLFLGVGGGPPGDEPQQGLFYTADSGQTWEQLYQGGVDDVAVSPNYTQDHTVLIGAGGYHWNGGILKSTDNGRTWQPSYEGLPWGGDGGTGGITFSPTYAQDHTVFCVSWGALYKSTDEGAHWTWVSPNLGYSWGTINQFVMSPRYPRDQTLWLSGYSEGNIISTDGGNTWRALLEAVTPLAAGAYCPEGGACYIELFGRVWGQNNQNYAYKSFDGGKTWHCLESAYLPPPMALRAFLPFIGKN